LMMTKSKRALLNRRTKASTYIWSPDKLMRTEEKRSFDVKIMRE
jgi:hypothetical protein